MGDEDIRRLEWAGGDVAVLACQVTNLACFGLGIVAGWDLATNERVEMTECRGAITISRNRLVVNVVQERSLKGIWEARKIHIDKYTSTIRVGSGGDVTANTGRVAVGQDCSIGDASWIVRRDSGITELAGNSWDDWSVEDWRTFNEFRAWGLGIDESKARKGSECDGGMHVDELLDERRQTGTVCNV